MCDIRDFIRLPRSPAFGWVTRSRTPRRGPRGGDRRHTMEHTIFSHTLTDEARRQDQQRSHHSHLCRRPRRVRVPALYHKLVGFLAAVSPTRLDVRRDTTPNHAWGGGATWRGGDQSPGPYSAAACAAATPVAGCRHADRPPRAGYAAQSAARLPHGKRGARRRLSDVPVSDTKGCVTPLRQPALQSLGRAGQTRCRRAPTAFFAVCGPRWSGGTQHAPCLCARTLHRRLRTRAWARARACAHASPPPERAELHQLHLQRAQVEQRQLAGGGKGGDRDQAHRLAVRAWGEWGEPRGWVKGGGQPGCEGFGWRVMGGRAALCASGHSARHPMEASHNCCNATSPATPHGCHSLRHGGVTKGAASPGAR